MNSPSHLRDSAVYGDLWADPQVREWFGEQNRTRLWSRILGWIALAQADIGAMPIPIARRIAQVCADAEPPIEWIARRRGESGHSSLGLIEWLQQEVGAPASGYVATATTVQDISDTWTALAMREVGTHVRTGLLEIRESLVSLATEERRTPMLARTHGQPAVPTTLGWKVASWGAEIDRHLTRFVQGADRWERCPLGGSVGTMAYWGADAPALLAAFARRSGLPTEVLPWGAARDCVAEFAGACALVTGTLARIGNEIYQLQRPEIGEAVESGDPRQIGSVTMPHKRNPERSEHLVTLNTLVRGSASTLVAAMVGEHERDGRSWKTEWIALPDLCCFVSASVGTAGALLRSVSFDPARMRENLRARAREVFSEQRIRGAGHAHGYRDAYAGERSLLSAATIAAEAGPAMAPTDRTDSGVPPRNGDDMADLDLALASAVALTERWLQGGPR